VSLSNQIKSFAVSLGFHNVGIAKAEAFVEEKKHLLHWLAHKYAGTMNWMERNTEKRVDVRTILPEAKSVISVAMNYYTPHQHSEKKNTGKISRYAWGDDYHDILTPKLEQLLDWIKSQEPKANGKVYVDTGPVLEKVWAQKAGIGWEGKHTNIISKEFGSWIFLGEIILNLELECDVTAIDHCGTCTLCLDACPTQAIVEPYVLDATKCISYLTIEYKGEIDSSLAQHFDGWLYGCDVCQDVCPWNHKFAEPTNVVQFEPRENNIQPKLEEIENLSEEEFRTKFKGSAMKRTKLSGLKRNAQAILTHKI
jgi:epoxyqueuosine reductase